MSRFKSSEAPAQYDAEVLSAVYDALKNAKPNDVILVRVSRDDNGNSVRPLYSVHVATTSDKPPQVGVHTDDFSIRITDPIRE